MIICYTGGVPTIYNEGITRSVISQHHYSQRSSNWTIIAATQRRINLSHYNTRRTCPPRHPCYIEACGTEDRTHSSMYGCFTQTRLATVPWTSRIPQESRTSQEDRIWSTCTWSRLGDFTPIVLSTTGIMCREAKTFYQRLADMIVLKEQHPTHQSWDGWEADFPLPSYVQQLWRIRGSRSSLPCPICSSEIPLHNLWGTNPTRLGHFFLFRTFWTCNYFYIVPPH